MNDEIDEIWESLKKETHRSKTKDISHLWQSQGDSKQRQKEEMEIMTNSKSISDKTLVPAGENKSFNLSNLTKVLACDGDSDDESEDGSISTPKEPEDNTRLSQIRGMIRSDDRQQRVQFLQILKADVENLHKKMNLHESSIPELNLPRPYDVGSISLTYKQNGGIVSDLASEEFSEWNKTFNPLGKQFREADKEPQKDDERTPSFNPSYREKLQNILDTVGKSLFKLISDSSEKCRLLSIEIIQLLLLSKLNIGKHVAYLMPAIFSRMPTTQHDPELNIFVQDTQSLDFYKRGGAKLLEQQKRVLTRSEGSSCSSLESCEETRFGLINLLETVIRSCLNLGVLSFLDAYFTDIIFALESSLADPFHKVKIKSADILKNIVRIPNWEVAAKYYATALARASLVLMRHRKHNVRIAGITMFEACVCVPDREKIKGAGSDAILDLIGFKEENVLPISAFYSAENGVNVNILAELTTDRHATVRLECCKVLCFLICCLPNRYDFTQRFLPYLLNFYNDDFDIVRDQAMFAIENCGRQYEVEHPDEVIERKQYGIDGDSRCNYEGQLPEPIIQRPSIGSRLFVRSNSKRFCVALLQELNNWIPKVRLQTAKLLKILTVYCEENLTMDFHETLSKIVKALKKVMSSEDKEDKQLQIELETLLTSIGRYVDPEVYTPLLLPSMFGTLTSKESCVVNLKAFQSLIKGSKPNRVKSQINLVLSTITGSFLQEDLICSTESSRLQLQVIEDIFLRVENEIMDTDIIENIDNLEEMLRKSVDRGNCSKLALSLLDTMTRTKSQSESI
ncbi:hypothetical protein CTEN210_16870 [Chaetoceros tenuissimus]|uniref:Uncharacterized protein n=1 Tax=Chaetoceros tenuissimus TaxID=426638 RepID=A0AAD3HEP2_9STRA|nr:hypothetical protein CTEN210_16870 [Chaetoceros tenuissimus]